MWCSSCSLVGNWGAWFGFLVIAISKVKLLPALMMDSTIACITIHWKMPCSDLWLLGNTFRKIIERVGVSKSLLYFPIQHVFLHCKSIISQVLVHDDDVISPYNSKFVDLRLLTSPSPASINGGDICWCLYGYYQRKPWTSVPPSTQKDTIY